MTVLDSSAIVDYLDGVEAVVDYVDERTEPPYLTSALCVYELLQGAGEAAPAADPAEARAAFGWVGSVDLTDAVAVESGRIQHRLQADGARLAPRDAVVAATARTAGHRLVATDPAFDSDPLRELVDVALPATE